MNLLGDVKNRDCIVFDDMIDSGGTIVNAIKKIKEEGANNIIVATTHPVFSGDTENEVVDKIIESGAKKIIITNTIQRDELENNENVIVVDLSKSIAGVIRTHMNKGSITDFFIKEYNTKL